MLWALDKRKLGVGGGERPRDAAGRVTPEQGEQDLTPAVLWQDAHSRHVGRCGHCGAGVGHGLAADSGLGALHQQQV